MRMMALVAAGAMVAVAAAGCGGGATSRSTRTAGPSAGAKAAAPTESNPPGDIPDNTVYVAFRPSTGLYEVKVPEGWARTDLAGGASFTDKLNTVRAEAAPAASAPTVQNVRDQALKIGAPRMAVVKTETVQRKGGTAIRLVYRFDSAPNPVTGKVVRDEAERYAFYKSGQEAVLTLSGPVGADNVDPWKTISDSFRWLR
ncbi:hypothetical protein [Actinomadura mexicana]|uniref:Lipoprotein n=1 Tax=Actinomadura mexicana TaxID=134959 RepID=A0A238V137_9ACTN|nr:hypothetical protein [Actinomadura mexicana]SNR27263.1 hypothetical protein SAMN06265355_101642 [Actinomadura mexicana]